MIYMGSKSQIAYDILDIILPNRGDRYFVEPFCGGCNMTDKVTGKRIASDINEYLIEFWKAFVYENYLPSIDSYTKEKYLDIKNNPDRDKKETGFAGICLSYRGIWFQSYNGDCMKRNFRRQNINHILRQREKLKGVIFKSCSYDELEIPDNSIIYCDPPYQNVGGYLVDFDHDKFWDWCRQMTSNGHKIFISEYNAPDDFRCVWSKELNSKLPSNKNILRNEKLFIPEGQKITLIEKPLF